MALYPIAKLGEIPPGSRKLVTIGKIGLGVFNVNGVFHAYRNVCPHAGAPVCQGRISGTTLPSKVYEYNYGREGCILRCPWHGWEFDLETGAHVVDTGAKLKNIPIEISPERSAGLGTENLEKFAVQRDADMICVVLPG